MDDSSDDEREASPEEAAIELYNLLVDLKVRNAKFTATTACIISYWATLAGAGAANPKCEVRKLALAPGQSSTGRYSAHFDKVTGTNLQHPDFCSLQLPLHSRAEGIRQNQTITVTPPHLSIEREIRSVEDWNGQLASCVRTLPPCYADHPVTQAALPELCLPLAVFIDGVQYIKRGSLIGFFVINMVTQRRHLFCTLRKTHICKCGCGGWCSLRPIFSFLDWSLKALARGRHPEQHHDGIAFRPAETSLLAYSGERCVRGAVLHLKADLAELGATFGFPTTATIAHPCMLCNCNHANMTQLEGWDAVESPHRIYSWEDYLAACTACEHYRVISQGQHRDLCLLLEWEKRKRLHVAGRPVTNLGLSLIEAYPALRLAKYDRVEPWGGMQNIDDFFVYLFSQQEFYSGGALRKRWCAGETLCFLNRLACFHTGVLRWIGFIA